jgi:hypothetical protein
MCTDGKPCFTDNDTFGINTDSSPNLAELSKKEIAAMGETIDRANKICKTERSYRTFALIGLVHQVEDLAQDGMELITANKLLDATKLFHELQDCRKAMQWLLDLPAELCPKVTPSDQEPEAAKVRAHSLARELLNAVANSNN